MRQSDWHEAEMNHHNTAATGHESCSKCYSKMAKVADNDEKPTYQDLAKAHADIASSHREASAFHKSCLKSIADELGKTIVPDGVRRTIPTNVPDNVTPVTRAGQPAFGKAVDTTNVPLNFQHLVQVSDSPD